MAGTLHNGQGSRARAIEQIVRAQLLLLALCLCATVGYLTHRGSPLALAGVVPIAVALLAVTRLLAALPGRELLALGRQAVVAIALLTFAGLVVLPRLGLYRPVTVLSGSMRPTFSPGDLIIVRPEPLRDVRVGQVISYSVPVGLHQVETHRVIRIIRGGDNPVVQTQGDANNWHDPWTAKLQGTTAWRLSVVVPYAGYAINALRSRTLHVMAVLVTPILVALLALAELWGLGRARPKLGNARP